MVHIHPKCSGEVCQSGMPLAACVQQCRNPVIHRFQAWQNLLHSKNPFSKLLLAHPLPLHYAVRPIINRGIIQVDLSAPKPKLLSASVNMYLGGWSLDDPICDKKLGAILLQLLYSVLLG